MELTVKFSKKSSVFPWVIVLCGGIFYFFQFILRASPSIMANEIMKDFGISATAFGSLAASYYYAYSIAQIPLGTLLDKVGPRKVLIFALFVCSCGTLIFSIASGFWIANIGRFFIGAGAAGAFVGTLRLSSLWLPKKQQALGIGITVALGKLGGLTTIFFLTYILSQYTWKTAMFLLSMIGFSLWAIFYLLIPENPDFILEQKRETKVPFKTSLVQTWFSLLQIMKKINFWYISMYGSLMYTPLSIFSDLWGISFLESSLNINKTLASHMIGFLLIGVCVGGPMVSLISDHLETRKIPMFVTALFSLLFNTILIFIPDLSIVTTSLLLFFIGFSIGGQALTFVVACEHTLPNLEGTTIGFVNTLVMFGGVIFQPLVGMILDYVSTGEYLNEFPIYSTSDYRTALSTIPICIFASTIISLILPETFLTYKKN